ncbi:hypothetical protein AVEN_263396-1, partial [Araneus ventricosus]
TIKEDKITPEERAKLGFFEAYQGFVEIHHYFQNLVHRFPECLSLIPIGMSSEGRPLQVLRLACLCYKENEETYELLNSFDWYILPILNPDGYEYAQNTDRLWRKTRSRHSNPQNCVGVDPNRNWDIKWSGKEELSL